jgi:hypothetical protein
MKKASNFTLWNGKLYLVTNKDKKAPIYKEVPELQLRLKIIDNAHKKGHFSIRSTMEKIRANYWWPNITIDLKKHISTCKQCQIFKPNRATPEELLKIKPNGIKDTFGIDFVGPLKPTQRGFQYMLVIIEHLTKF